MEKAVAEWTRALLDGHLWAISSRITIFTWIWILLDLLLCRAATLQFLMHPLERNNCTAYIRHLLERPPFLPTTDCAGAQVWQMISCCSFWWLSCIWRASGHIWTGRHVSTFELPSLSSYSGFSQTTTRKESASLSHSTHTSTYAPWYAARILWNPLLLLPLTDFGGAQMSISGDNFTLLILDTWLEWSPPLLHYYTKLLPFSLIKAIQIINLINHCPNVNFIWL